MMITPGEQIRAYVKSHGYSHADFAKLIGVSQTTVSNWISGRNQPTGPYIKKLSDIMRFSEVKSTLAEARERLTPVTAHTSAGALETPEGSVVAPENGNEPKTAQKRATGGITVEEAAEMMGKSIAFVHEGLKSGALPFGVAVKMEKWSYYISPAKFYDFIGVAPKGEK